MNKFVEARKKRFEAVLELQPGGPRTLYDVEAYDLRDAWKQLKVAVFTRTGLEILPGWFAEKDVSIYVREGREFRYVGSLRQVDDAFPSPKKTN